MIFIWQPCPIKVRVRRLELLSILALGLATCRTPPAPHVAAPSSLPAVSPPPPALVVKAGPARSPGPVLLSPADLDAMLEDRWRAAGLTPASSSDDSEFLRRVTLDVAGRIPTLDEAESFLASRDLTKRVHLVDGLLAGADYAEHWADVYVDLFVGRQFRKPKLEKQLDPRSYFVSAFRENRRFDQIARELLTFTGEILPNGPGVFLASHLKGGGPEMAASVTARLFLGVQIQCAQCHDHPYDARYKQEDFYGLVAYFARTKDLEQRRDHPGGSEPDPRADSARPNRKQEPQERQELQDDKIYLVIDKPRGQAKFKKVGADVETVVGPRFVGRTVAPLPGETPRQTLARAVVGSDLFAKTIVDRTWAQLFGHAILDPWDDLGGEQDPRHPPLLNRLADDFRASGFDMKHLLRTIFLSRAYGLTSRTPPAAESPASVPAEAAAGTGGVGPRRADVEGPPGDGDGGVAVTVNSATDPTVPTDPGDAFARAVVRRLTPEQLFRSLLVATGSDRMERGGGDDMDKKIARLLRECLFVFGDDEMAEVNTFNGNIPQALLLWNGEIVNQGARARPGGTLARILDDSRDAETRLRKMFLAAYSRPCTDAERTRLVPLLTGAKTPRAAYEDLFFAMLTSSEMLTIH